MPSLPKLGHLLLLYASADFSIFFVMLFNYAVRILSFMFQMKASKQVKIKKTRATLSSPHDL